MAQKTKLKCPECGLDRFTQARGLAIHRRYAHGVMGTAKSTLAARALREKRQTKPEPLPVEVAAPAMKVVLRGSQITRLQGKFKCPDCDFVANWKGGLTKHRSAKHGLLDCTVCGLRFASANSLNKHMHRNHSTPERTELAKTTQDAVAIATTNGHIHQAQDDEAHRLEAIATLAAGRIQQVIEGMAFSHNLPPKSLAALVIRTLGATAKVW